MCSSLVHALHSELSVCVGFLSQPGIVVCTEVAHMIHVALPAPHSHGGGRDSGEAVWQVERLKLGTRRQTIAQGLEPCHACPWKDSASKRSSSPRRRKFWCISSDERVGELDGVDRVMQGLPRARPGSRNRASGTAASLQSLESLQGRWGVWGSSGLGPRSRGLCATGLRGDGLEGETSAQHRSSSPEARLDNLVESNKKQQNNKTMAEANNGLPMSRSFTRSLRPKDGSRTRNLLCHYTGAATVITVRTA